jgi:hypothetical protein
MTDTSGVGVEESAFQKSRMCELRSLWWTLQLLDSAARIE